MAPLAANRAHVDFVIVSFGLAVNVLQEDQEEGALEMSLKGHSAQETAKALEVARATETVAESRFTRGFAEFDAVRAKYKSEPWYKDVHGNFTYLLLPYTDAQLHGDTPLKKIAAATPFRYDPMPTLRASTTPQLWVLGADYLEAPSAETSRLIKSLIGEGRPFTLTVYPGAEHGMTEFEVGPDGERAARGTQAVSSACREPNVQLLKLSNSACSRPRRFPTHIDGIGSVDRYGIVGIGGG